MAPQRQLAGLAPRRAAGYRSIYEIDDIERLVIVSGSSTARHRLQAPADRDPLGNCAAERTPGQAVSGEVLAQLSQRTRERTPPHHNPDKRYHGIGTHPPATTGPGRTNRSGP
jgi:hypothetical protein